MQSIRTPICWAVALAAVLTIGARAVGQELPLQFNETRLFLANADGSEMRRLAELEDFIHQGSPAWSPDGKQIAFDSWRGSDGNRASQILLINADGTNPRVLIDGAMPSFSPDGSRIVFSRYAPNTGVWMMSSDRPEKMLQLVDQQAWSGRWSPDGQKIVYAATSAGGANFAIHDPVTRQRRLLFEEGGEQYRSMHWNFIWSPDSKQILFKGTALDGKAHVAVVDERGAKFGLTVLLAKSVSENFAWSPDGSRVLLCYASPERGGRSQLYYLTPGESPTPQLLPGQDPTLSHVGVAYSPDGKRLAIASRRHVDAVTPSLLQIDPRSIDREPEQVSRQSRRMPPAARYERLISWVLPGRDHASFRLNGYFTPVDPAPIAANQWLQTSVSPASRRAHVGGWVDAPAMNLVATAAELRKLDDLLRRVTAAPVASPADRNGQLALLAMIHARRQDERQAVGAIAELAKLAAQGPTNLPEEQLWPAIVTACGLMPSPKLRVAMNQVMNVLYDRQYLANGARTSEIIRHFRTVRATGNLLGANAGDASSFGTDPGLAYWQIVTRGTAATRGEGRPRAHWSFYPKEGRLLHNYGHGEDCVYLSMPLVGDFVFECEMNSRGTRVGYGGQLVGLRPPSGSTFDLVTSLRTPTVINVATPVDAIGETCRFRLESSKGQVIYSVNGRELYRRPLGKALDPWLFVREEGHRYGSFSVRRLSGAASVPQQLELSRSPNLDGWLSEYYDETVGQSFVSPDGQTVASTGGNWEKRGEEIRGMSSSTPLEQLAAATGFLAALSGGSSTSRKESLLQYHRPMLEDGVIEYEFFYEPGRTLVHPAIDRLTFIVDPQGIKLHWLTDGQHERTGSAADNLTDEPSHRRGPGQLPLKAGEWNRAKLALTGDVATLTLNDVDVYQRPLERTNQRFFGLCHFSDQTEARVRNVTWRGAWPTSLPPAAQLFARQVEWNGDAGL